MTKEELINKLEKQVIYRGQEILVSIVDEANPGGIPKLVSIDYVVDQFINVTVKGVNKMDENMTDKPKFNDCQAKAIEAVGILQSAIAAAKELKENTVEISLDVAEELSVFADAFVE